MSSPRHETFGDEPRGLLMCFHRMAIQIKDTAIRTILSSRCPSYNEADPKRRRLRSDFFLSSLKGLFNCRVYCVYGLSRLQVTGVPKLLRGMI